MPIAIKDSELWKRFEEAKKLLDRCVKAFGRAGWEYGEKDSEISVEVMHWLSQEKLEDEIFGDPIDLQAIVDKLPKTRDGLPVVIGMKLKCPNGHAIEVRPSDRMGGRFYCCTDECYSSGCQNDDGSGTYYDSTQLTTAP